MMDVSLEVNKSITVVDSIESDVSIAVDAISEDDGTAVDDGVDGFLVE